MLRPIACAVLLASAIFPVEHPAAQAADWREVLHTGWCVDRDSEQVDRGGVIWAFKSCILDYVFHAKVDCAHQQSDPDKVDWYWDDGSGGGWASESSSRGTSHHEMVMEECEGWFWTTG